MKKAPSSQVQKTALGVAHPNTPAPANSSGRYDAAFRQQAVENWLRSNQPGTQVAAENRALKAELARVREQHDILIKTLGILAEPPKNASSASKP